ncbi:MAG: hypothetical protein LLG06_19660 [Desulfobacteraceae bacterium]|nr:hypothetical protein [Desulfobacteraceae bacterium]
MSNRCPKCGGYWIVETVIRGGRAVTYGKCVNCGLSSESEKYQDARFDIRRPVKAPRKQTKGGARPPG